MKNTYTTKAIKIAIVITLICTIVIAAAHSIVYINTVTSAHTTPHHVVVQAKK